jgi:hypothetical protein
VDRANFTNAGFDSVFVTLHTWLPEHMGVSHYPKLPPAKERDDMLGAAAPDFWTAG